MSIRSQAIEWEEPKKQYDTDVPTDRETLEDLCKNMTQVQAFKHNEIQKYLTNKLNNKLNNAIKKLKQPLDETSTAFARGFIVLAEEILLDIEIVTKKVDIEIEK